MVETQHLSNLAPGATVGRYVLVEAIGRGSMGEVWAAIDPDLDRKVAVKLLRPDRLATGRDRARLDAEARAMARLTHPNVVAVHDVGQLDGQLFIAMEFIAGETLEHWMARGPHPYPEVLKIVRQAAAGLAAAHRQGLVHRDFKPANVILGDDGRVRVLDFGLAQPEDGVDTLGLELEGVDPSAVETRDDGPVSAARSRAMLDGNRRIQGSPAYMAPEQHRGGVVDARSDLFSLCVCLFEALYGVRPFTGQNRLSVALTIVSGRMVELSAEDRARVPEWIHAIVVRGLARDPNARYPTIEALLAALERSPEQRQRRRIQVMLVSAGVLAVVGLGLGFVLGREPPLDPCADAGLAIVDLWTPAIREQLGQRIDEVPDRSERASQRLLEGLDHYASNWEAASIQVCRDREARRLTERLQVTREACLAERRGALAMISRLAGDRSDSTLVRAVALQPFAALRALSDPRHCVDRHRPASERAPVTPEQQVARAELELRLAVLDTAPPVALLDEIGTETATDPELALLLGRVAGVAADREAAEAQLHATAAATTGAEPQLAAWAWLALAELALAELELPELSEPSEPSEPSELGDSPDLAAHLIEVRSLIAYADALLPRDDDLGRIELGRLAARVAVADPQGQRPALLDAALTELAHQPLRDPDLHVELLELRARLHDRAGHSAAAEADRSAAISLRRDAFGDP